MAGLARSRLKEALWSSDTLVVLARPAGGDPVAAPGLELRAAGPDDGERYAADIGTESAASFRERLRACRCFVITDNKHFLHSTWVTTSAAWTRELRTYLAVPQGHAYTYESFTRPDARGWGLYPLALKGICAQVGAEGVTTVWVAIEGRNTASLKAVGKAGFEPVFRIDYGRRLGRVFIRDRDAHLSRRDGLYIKRKAAT